MAPDRARHEVLCSSHIYSGLGGHVTWFVWANGMVAKALKSLSHWDLLFFSCGSSDLAAILKHSD